jgi:Flp pilus assembly protein TadD
MNLEENKVELINYIEKASVAILGLVFILFPVFFTNITTDFFNIPKQALIVFASCVLMLLFGAKSLLLKKIRIKRTPFDFAILLFLSALILSSVFSASLFESLTNVLPVIFGGLLFFGIVYNIRNEKSLIMLLGCFLGGGVITSLITVLSHFQIYVLPFDFAKNVSFTPLGSGLEQAIYLLLVLTLGGYFLLPLARKNYIRTAEFKSNLPKFAGFAITSIIVLIGLILSIYNIEKLQQVVILPWQTGFQTAFASISQDSGRILQGFLFGNGFGEYLMDFTKFKQASFNSNPTLWNLTFIRSSTFLLEILATTGVLGLFSFLYLCYKAIKEKPLFVPLVIALGVTFVLPISFFNLIIIFFIFGIYASLRGFHDRERYFDVEIELVALKKGFISFSPEETRRERSYDKLLSSFVFIAILLIVLVFGFFTYDYLAANITFEKSLVAANQNNGQLTYTYQSSALGTLTGKYVDSYYRVFSQTNLALANSLAASVPQGASVNAQTQQTIYTLVQQSINAARQATVVSPQNTINWQNLASIYRSLIGFGQNADSFAILAGQQAVTLDPSDPQVYITLGGIYYQIRSWAKAQETFQQAINLKPNYANAYYNLGHVLEESGDLNGALTQFQTVRTLVANDPTNLAKINAEISALQNQIGQQQAAAQTQTTQTQPSPLSVPTSQTLPPQKPPVKIPAPKTSLTPTGSETPSLTPSPTP